MTATLAATSHPRTHMAVLVVLGLMHLLNDLMQSLIPAAYASAFGMNAAYQR